MGDIYDQFELELASLDRKYAGHPRRLMIRLFLLALEREEIVSVGYREELIAGRLDTMPISEQERETLRHALLWIGKDEEIHAFFLRGAIFEILATALDDNDQLVPEETADSLAQKIRAVGEFFLPRARRSRLFAENALGSGGQVRIVQGKALEEKLSLFRGLLDGHLRGL